LVRAESSLLFCRWFRDVKRRVNGARRGTELGIKAAEIRCNQQRDTAETIIETITKFGKGWTISEADFWLQIRSRSQSQLFKLAGRKIADRVIIL